MDTLTAEQKREVHRRIYERNKAMGGFRLTNAFTSLSVVVLVLLYPTAFCVTACLLIMGMI